MDVRLVEDDPENVRLVVGNWELALGDPNDLDSAVICQAMVERREELLRELDGPSYQVVRTPGQSIGEAREQRAAQVSFFCKAIIQVVLHGAASLPEAVRELIRAD